MKANAAMFYGPDNLVVEEREFSQDNNESVVKVNACAVCGYDARVYRNGHKKVKTPLILGHEICAEVLQDINTSDGVLRSGTRIAVSPIIPCLGCKFCNKHQYNLCNNLREIGSTVDGGFAGYLKIPKEIIKIGGLVQVPDNLKNEEVALLEPLACCLNGFSQLGEIEPESSILIIGDGAIGLTHLQLAKRLHHAKTAVVGKIESRIQKAKSMGADEAFIFGNQTVDDVLSFTDGYGSDIIIVATSNPDALNLATMVAGKNSKINLFSGFSNGHGFSPDPNWLHYNQVSIMGSFSSTPKMLQKAATLASDGMIDLSKIATHRYSLGEIKQAVLATEEFHGLRAVIDKF
ncbi:alcohol dehydrogenase catalytic domain-containing protein [Candidatus Nitrosotalea okcheonensis]|uniref:alcohol dehydrogenase catalytic domain-containing protein n=1 Tax=Candidatus Nitrosotalea okcheonensis TaxID=1903276 RepID=UPI0013900045|nr:alcohol dehydrogenase catalytic domain-containing protein [Candidatus Nitrosotalea okcheonensis]